MLFVYKIFINLILVLSPLIVLVRLIKKKEDPKRFKEKLGFFKKKKTKGRTTIVIAHRLSTILNSDVIYVIDKGKVIDHGKHDGLMKTSKTYKNFYEKQLRKS